MARYTSGMNGLTLSTSNDTRTVITTATGAGSVVKVHEIFFGGEASSSAVARIAVNRPGTAGITPTTVATEKMNPASVASTFTVASGWSTQPVLSTNHVLIPTFNAFGGLFRWQAPPDGELVVGTQGAVANLSVRSLSGTSVVSGHLVIEEL